MPQQVLPTPQGVDVALVQFEDNCRPATLGALIGTVAAVCGRRRTEPLLRSRDNGRTGEARRPRVRRRLKPCASRCLRLKDCGGERLRVHATQETLPRGNVTSTYLGNVTKSSFPSQL